MSKFFLYSTTNEYTVVYMFRVREQIIKNKSRLFYYVYKVYFIDLMANNILS